MNNRCYLTLLSILFLTACSIQKDIARSANKTLFTDPTLSNAHVGISIYDTKTGKYIYNHQQNKFFVPASNTKIFTCYAAMKYLGDSLTSINYINGPDSLYIFPAGDPTLLHPDFANQPAIKFLQKQNKPISITTSNWRDNALGYGWTWSDYNSSYMAERNSLPVYANLIRFVQIQQVNATDNKEEPILYTEPDINWKLNFNPDAGTKVFSVRRNLAENIFRVTTGNEKDQKQQSVPFVTNGIQSAAELLKDTIYKEITISNFQSTPDTELETIYSQPTDSLLKPMMHVSDNFYAEQSLLMVSNKLLGYMDADRIIDTLLRSDLEDLPQKPRWVDGSGLSRYNLFTPQDFVWVLNRMRTEFSFDRLKLILPTGNEGTLNNYYVSATNQIFAKTGTLSGQVALSGYLITRKNKLLIFSVLVNNHNGSAVGVRRQVEEFLLNIRDKY